MTKLLAVLLVTLFTAEAFAVTCTLSYKPAGSAEKKVVLKPLPSVRTMLILSGDVDSVAASYASDLRTMTETLQIATEDGVISGTKFKINSQNVMELTSAVNDNWATLRCFR